MKMQRRLNFVDVTWPISIAALGLLAVHAVLFGGLWDPPVERQDEPVGLTTKAVERVAHEHAFRSGWGEVVGVAAQLDGFVCHEQDVTITTLEAEAHFSLEPVRFERITRYLKCFDPDACLRVQGCRIADEVFSR